MTDETTPGVVIVGASHAGVQLGHGLRRYGWEGGITIVGEEPDIPYHRPPLSKDFLKGKKEFRQILLRQEAMYERESVRLLLGHRVTGLHRDTRRVALDDGTELDYDKLVLATGARPRRLPIPGIDLPGVCYVRTVADIRRMLEDVRAGGRAVIVGGGYIGLEAAASLRALGMNVTVVEAEERLLKRITCERMSEFYARVHREEGVLISTGVAVAGIKGDEHATGVRIESGEVLPADLVVVGIGIVPEVSLAEQAGLTIDNGIVVDEYGRTSDPDIYAAGDCASFVHPLYDRFLRLESVQNAHDQAVVVAKSICGRPEPYRDLPWFWSDQYDVKLQIAGLSEGSDEIIERGDPETGRSFALCYLRKGRLLAVDAVNRAKDFVQAKKVIGGGARFDRGKLADADTPLDAAIAD